VNAATERELREGELDGRELRHGRTHGRHGDRRDRERPDRRDDQDGEGSERMAGSLGDGWTSPGLNDVSVTLHEPEG
jgi:hypothetical protein